MHETKSPHMNHIHQHKSHNTIDLDLQSLYSISIRKYYNDIVCSKLFSQSSKLTLKWERALILIHIWVEFPRRRAHGIFKEGAPSGRNGAAKCGRVGCHLSTLHTCVKSKQIQGEGATSFICGLPPQGCATSPRGVHLPMHMCSNLITTSSINHQSHWLCPL